MNTGGRGAARLVEEILFWNPGNKQLANHPIDAAEAQAKTPTMSSPRPVTIPGANTSQNSLLGYFPGPQCHVTVNIQQSPEGIVASDLEGEYDFHITETDFAGITSASYECSITGCIVQIVLFEAVLSTADQAHIYNGQAGRDKLRTAVRDVLEGRARPIREGNPAASRNFDLRRILPKLGFVYDADAHHFDPPREPDDLCLRMLLLELTQISMTEPFAPPLCQAFNVTTIPWGLSNEHYGTLGEVSNSNDEHVLMRYDLQIRNDPKHIPWYLEALKQLAQIRDSEALQTRVLEAMSLGAPVLGDVLRIYGDLGVDTDVTDEQLLDLLETNPSKLETLAEFRDSALLRQAAAAPTLGYDTCFQILGYSPGLGSDAQLSASAQALAESSKLGRFQALRALKVIGIMRQSPKLLSLYEKLGPPVPEMSPEEACALLGVSSDMDDSDILAIYDIAVDDSTERILEFRAALKTLAETRHSPQLQSHLNGESDLIDLTGDEPRLPVGLLNIGNTCYLNSVLQFYYNIPLVRQYAENFAQETTPEHHHNPLVATKRVGGRLVPVLEVRRSQVFVQALGQLYKEMDTAMTSLVSPTIKLAYMAFFPPQIDNEKDVRELGRKQDEGSPKETQGNDITNQNVDTTDKPEASTPEPSPQDESGLVDLTQTSDEQSALSDRLAEAIAPQQDVTECIENVLFQFEAAGEANDDSVEKDNTDLIKQLFYGTYVQNLDKVDGSSENSSQVVRQWSIPAHLGHGPTSIYTALDNYFLPEKLGSSVRRMALRDPPHILQLQVQRVQFDPVTGSVYKLLDPLVFDKVVWLDRYLEQKSPELQTKVEEAQRLREELAQIDNAPKEDEEREWRSLQETQDWIDTFAPGQVSEQTQKLMAERRQSLDDEWDRRRIRRESITLQLSHQFEAFQTVGYRPLALFVHSGISVNSGHYWVYIWNEDAKKWYKYNDEIVTEVSEEQVLDFRENNAATPYFIVFRRLEGEESRA